RARAQEVSRTLISTQASLKLSSAVELNLMEDIKKRRADAEPLKRLISAPAPSLDELESKIHELKRQAWELENLRKEELRSSAELNRTREAYAQVRKELLALGGQLSEK